MDEKTRDQILNQGFIRIDDPKQRKAFDDPNLIVEGLEPAGEDQKEKGE